jgi:hypothetical protein
MFVGRSKRSRFNLLLLSEGEHYFSDYSAIYYPECKTDEESYKRSEIFLFQVFRSTRYFFHQIEPIVPCLRSCYNTLR